MGTGASFSYRRSGCSNSQACPTLATRAARRHVPRSERLMMHVQVMCDQDVVDSVLAELRSREARSVEVGPSSYDPLALIQAEVPSATLWGFPQFVYSVNSGALYWHRLVGHEPAPANGGDGTAGRPVRPKPSG